MVYLSCHSENFGINNPDENFEFIRRIGFDRVDVSARSVVPQERITAEPGAAAKWMRELAARHNIKLSELFLGAVEVNGKSVSPASPEAVGCEAFYKNFESICSFTAEAGFESVMSSGGSVIDAIGREASFDNAEAVYARMTDIAEKAGVMLTIEPSRLSLFNSPAAALEMVRRVPKLRYTLDLLHYQVNAYPQEESMKLLPWAGHVHARQAAVGWLKCPVEFGEIDYDAFIKRMRGMNWEGTIAMEYWCGPAEDAAGILAIDQNILMRYELKRLIRKYFG